jgi:cytochrome c oxidase subunit II
VGIEPSIYRFARNGKPPRLRDCATPFVSALGLIFASSAALAAGRASNDMGYLEGFGARAHPVVALTWGLLVISIVVVAIVAFLLLFGIFRRRPDSSNALLRPSEHSNAGLRWVYVGTGLSTLALLIAAFWTMRVLAGVVRPGEEPKLALDIVGHQWWWEVRYSGDPDSRVFATANEIHIPTGAAVRLRLLSRDVIHSFWIPALSGKTDLIPGQTNVTWIEADRPGVYRGQCAEFCGQQHAHMAMYVVAQTPEDFERWRDAQIAPATPNNAAGLASGRRSFETRCGACHTVRGTDAGGIVGPDLTHLMSRANIAAGLLPNTPAYLDAWIADPQKLKPGTQMPRVALGAGELQSIGAFLETLR